jgi:hypothetical protein
MHGFELDATRLVDDYLNRKIGRSPHAAEEQLTL